MTNFARCHMQHEHPAVRSLLDVDFYKFTMGQMIWKEFRGTEVTFSLINRSRSIKLARAIDIDELDRQLRHVQTLMLRKPDIDWLQDIDVYGVNMFSSDYLAFLRTMQLGDYTLTTTDDEQIELTFTGPWEVVTFWETIAIAIVNELYYRAQLRRAPKQVLDEVYARAKVKLFEKLRVLKEHPDIRFADFGTRRRHSFLWQQWVVGMCKEMLGQQFTGTSNTWMAFNQDLVPIGTNAHELPMVLTALADTPEEMRTAQYDVLRVWQESYGDGLRICLPDTFGTKQFLESAPDWLAHRWRGFRQDSGDPYEVGEIIVDWYRANGVDPQEKLIIFSDGLSLPNDVIDLHKHFADRIQVAFGVGTNLTNDFASQSDLQLAPLSLVAKATAVEGRPTVKLPDDANKATGPDDIVKKYRRVFGTN